MSERKHDGTPRIATLCELFSANSLLMQRCAMGRSSEMLQEERATTAEACCHLPIINLTPVTSWGWEVDSGVSESVKEVSFSPCKFLSAFLPVVEESLFELTHFQIL